LCAVGRAASACLHPVIRRALPQPPSLGTGDGQEYTEVALGASAPCVGSFSTMEG